MGMGTVVTFAMLFGAVALFFTGRLPVSLRRGIGVLMLLSGLWNVLWYGLRNFGEFWGNAALVSGVVMVAASVIILLEAGWLRITAPPGPVRMIASGALVLCLLLYGVTIIQLGLGQEIIG